VPGNHLSFPTEIWSSLKRNAMIGFEIQLNGQRVCTVGMDQDGAITAIATWLKRPRDLTLQDPMLAGEEITFDVAGSAYNPDNSRDRLKWIGRDLQVGDELHIKVVETSQVDEPELRSREEP
jgi:hypothetical protein